MTICTIDDHAPARSGASLWSRLREAWSNPGPVRGPLLDPRDLSEHLQRDLGFLDGNTVYDRPSDIDVVRDDDLSP